MCDVYGSVTDEIVLDLSSGYAIMDPSPMKSCKGHTDRALSSFTPAVQLPATITPPRVSWALALSRGESSLCHSDEGAAPVRVDGGLQGGAGGRGVAFLVFFIAGGRGE